MSMNSLVVIPSDYVVSPANGIWSGNTTVTYTVPGAGRSYQSNVTSTTLTPVTAPGEDAQMLQSVGWLGLDGGINNLYGAGSTANRPTMTQKQHVGTFYVDTTLGALLVYAGPTSKWCNAISGASNQ
jgi:hypothetical protein